MRTATIHVERQCRYPMSPAEAWRLLADTDHLNRTVGLPPVEFSPLPDPLVRAARATAFGLLPVRWKEFPFSWVREQRYVVRREFEHGPLDAVEVGIELTPMKDDVVVTSFADFTAARIATPLVRRFVRAQVDELLSFCDRYLARRDSGKADPVPNPKRPTSVDHGRLEQLLTQLRQAPVQGALIARLAERIREGSDDQLVRVRAYALADVWRADRHEVLRLLLYATRCGLFELRWDLMCPNCRVPKQEVDSLARLQPQFHCDVCGISYGADFDRSVELRFAIHPAVRVAADAVYCIGGPLRTPHIAAQQYLRPGEERQLTLRSSAPLHLRTVGSTSRLAIVAAPADPRRPTVRLAYADGSWIAPHSVIDDGVLMLPGGAVLSLRNQTARPVLAVAEEAAWTADATTAAQVTTLQEFRDLFSSELLAPGQQHAIRHIALLFSDLKGSTRMYERIGDASAYSRVNRHFDFIRQAVVKAGGAIVKTLGDGVMCSFLQLDDALDVAITMQEEVESWCAEQRFDPPLTLKLGVHAGPVIAMTANDRLDYFGRTVNIAARLGEQSHGDDVVLLREVFERATPEVIGRHAEIVVEPFLTRLRGMEDRQELVRVMAAPTHDPAPAEERAWEPAARGLRDF